MEKQSENLKFILNLPHMESCLVLICSWNKNPVFPLKIRSGCWNAPDQRAKIHFLDSYRVMNLDWKCSRGAETFDMERNPPGTRRHRLSAPQKQLQSVPACREHLSDERVFFPRAKNPTTLNGLDPYYLRCSPFLSDSLHDFVVLKIFHYDLIERKKC